MTPKPITKNIDLGDGRTISLETGKLAKQADGSVVVRVKNTILLATVVSNQDAKEGVDFLPLTVDYREKFSAAGKFPGGFFKREAKPSDDEVLTMRLVDRALRPLFPKDYHSDTQIQLMLLSSDKEEMPDALTCLAASAAIAVSDIPFNGPVSEVRIGRIDGKFIINPTFEQLETSDIDIMVAATKESIVMVEGEMKEISETLEQEGLQIFMDVVEQEKEWAQYLFKDGSMIGLNAEILNQYIEYIANQRLAAIGFTAPFNIKSNPLPWMNSYLVSDNVQVAPQEAEISSYLVGQVDSSVSSDDFDGFDL